MIHRMKYFLLFIVFVCCYQLAAQEPFVFLPINTSNGLSDNRVRAIAQLSDGRMVFATEGLINIYDGTEFIYLHADDNKVYPVPNYNGFHRFYMDDENRLWLKNQTKLACFNLLTEMFVPNVDSLFQSNGINYPVIDFFVDSNQNSWYLTNINDLFFKRKGEKKAVVFVSQLPNLQDKSEQLFHAEVRDSLVFLFFKSGQLDCYNLQTQKLLYTEKPFGENPNRYARTLIVVPHDQYLYQLRSGTFSGGVLVRYNYLKRKWDEIFKDIWQNDLFVDKDGNCWTCSTTGLRKIDATLKEANHTSQFKLSDGKSIETEISNQFIDRDGGFWLGTESNGLLYYHPDRFKFKNYDASFFNISDNKRLAIHCLIDYNRDLLVGTENGLYHFSNDKKSFQLFLGIPSNSFCNQLVEDSKDRIWLCTRQHGAFCIDNGKIKQFDLPFACQYLYESNDGQFYLTTTEGFGLFDPETGKYEKVDASTDLGHIFQLIQFSKNQLLGVLYAEKGLFVYNTKTKTIEYPNDSIYPFLVHSNKKYHDIFIDHRNIMWFGTQDGLFVYNPSDGFSRSFFKEDGLMNNNIRSITEDNQGRIWVSASYGISCISIAKEGKDYTFSFSNFNHLDGVIGNEFLPRSVKKSKDNQLLWGGLNGFNIIDLNSYNAKKSVLPIPVFTRFYISGKEIKVGNIYRGNLVLQNTINNTKELKLKYFQNFISFDLSALNYVNPTQTYYKYQLEGIDNLWIEIRPSNGIGHINYTNLSPGSYKLRVKATNNSMKWPEQYAEMNIKISPPFWKTTLAYFLYFILIASTLTFTTIEYSKRSKAKLKKKQKEELDQLKMVFYTNISHELKTPLTLVITPLDSILKKHIEEPLKSKLTSVYKNALDLLQLVNQLLDFRKLEMKGERLQLEYCQVDEFLQTIVDSFHEYAQEKGIELSSQMYSPGIFAMVDSDKLKKIINNLLSNALKYTNQGGQVTLTVKKNPVPNEAGAKIIISVSDTGCGIQESDLPHLFDRFYQGKLNDPSKGGSGIGLHLVKQYVQMHNGTVSVQSQLNYGSTFILEIPDQLETIHAKPRIENQPIVKSSFKILVVEDNLEFCQFLSQELSEYYEVTTAPNGAKGLEKVRTLQPDLVITDVMMPIMTGTELCNCIKTDIQISHIPVVMLTAKSSTEDQMEGFKVYADAYITKPFKLDLLLLRISNLIELQERRKALFKEQIEIKPNSIATTIVDEEFIKSLMKHIERNLSDIDYSIEQMSYDMNMDRTTLYRKLTAISGLSPVEFLRSVRLKKAALLLEQGHSIADVASMVGFGTVSYFSKCFKVEFNVKPSQYKGRNL
jgi:signal transduction histidine kinase/DNA-binding response OmpR family regulator/ligand-binding sensor domain-containing protein